MMATIGESMGERGKVRRMNSSSSDIDVVPEGEEDLAQRPRPFPSFHIAP